VSVVDHRSSARAPGVNQLTFAFITTGPEAGQVRPVVDGEDLLTGYRNNRGLNPDRLLPPLSTALLPTRHARSVLIGSCSCGETRYGSLWLSSRRDADQVMWEPVTNPHDETLRYFPGKVLLTALDDAAHAWSHPPAGRGVPSTRDATRPGNAHACATQSDR
jgi:hypothetical protein